MAATGAGNEVVDAINAGVSDQRVRLAMLMGSYMESGWQAGAVGDNGHSFGPFQINFPTHPGVSQAQATNPSWAVRYMLGEYTGGVSRVREALWAYDPKHAAALAAFYSERPLEMYPQSRIDSAWKAVTGLGAGTAPPTGTTPASPPGTTPGTGTGTPDPGGGTQGFNPVSDAIDKTKNYVLITLGVLGGIGLVVMGAWRSTSARSSGGS